MFLWFIRNTMSKSISRYGKVLFKNSIEVTPAKSVSSVQYMLAANTQAQKMYKKDYDRLNDKQKQAVHYALRTKEELETRKNQERF